MALRLDSAAGTFTTYATVSLSSIPGTVLNSPIVVGESCNLIMSGSTVYSLSSTGLSSVRSFTNIRAYSSSLRFIIDGRTLFGFSNNSFVSTTLGAFSFFNINNNLVDNLVISGYNVTGTTTFSI
jgi:hypothetical protein